MPATVSHALSATTPDNTSYEIRPSHWNSSHLITLALMGSEMIGGFSNANGVTFGLSGTAITASVQTNYLTTAMASNAGSNFAGTTLGATNLSATLNSLGLAISGPVETGVGVSANGSSQSGGVVVFSNAGNVSFGMNSLTVTATASFVQTNQTVASGNIAGTGVTTTTQAGSTLGVTQNTAGLSLAVPAWVTNAGGAGGVDVSLTGNTSGALALVSSGTMILAGGNNITLSQNGQSITISGANLGGAQTGISGLVVSNTTYTSGTVSFSNANGITFGSSAGQAITASYNSTQFAGTSTGAVNLSVTLNSQGISISGPVETGVGISANGSSASVGVVTLSNSNNVSFGMNGAVVTASASQSVQTQASGNLAGTGVTTTTQAGSTLGVTQNTAGLSLAVPAWVTVGGGGNFSAGVSGGNTSNTSGTTSNAIVFAGGNNITLSASTGAGGMSVTISGANAGGAQTGISGVVVSNTTYTSGTISFSNANGITFGSSAGQAITASANFGLVGGAAGTQTQTTGTIVFSNSNGISFGMSNSSVVTASFSQTVQTQASGNLAGTGVTTTTQAGSTLGVTQNTAGLSLAVPAWVTVGGGGNFSAGVSGGNTSNTSGTTSNAIVFAGGNNITLSASTGAGGMSVTISGANAGGAQTGISGLVVSNTTYTSGTVTFQNANGISFGSSGANGISASYTVPTQTTQTLGIYASSQTTGGASSSTINATAFTIVGSGGISVGMTNGSMLIADGPLLSLSAGTTNLNLDAASVVVFSNSNNVSFGVNGSTVTASVSQSVQTQASGNIAGTGVTTTTQAGSTLGVTHNTAGLSLAVPAWVTNAGAAAINFSAGTTSSNIGSVVFSNSNGVSFGLNGSTMTASVAPLDAAYVVGNTTGASTSSNWTVGSLNVSFAGIVSGGWSNSTLIISAPASTTVAYAGTSLATVTNTGSVLTGAINTNGITLSVPQWVTAGGGGGGVAIAASNTTFTSGTVVMSAAGGALTISSGAQSVLMSVPQTSSLVAGANITISTAGSTISIIGGAGGAGFTGGISGGNTSGTSGSVSNALYLAGGANITLSGATGAGGMTVTISGGAGGGGGVAIAASNTTFTSGTVVMSAAGGALTISSGAQSVLMSVPQTSSLVGTNGISISTNGSTISVSNIGLSVSAGTTSNAATGITFSNSNGVSFGLSTGVGLATITASVAAYPTTAAYLFSGNTTGQSSTSTAGNQTLSISMAGGISGGWSNSSWLLSTPLALGTATAGTNITWTANTAGLSINASGYVGTGTGSGSTNGALAFSHNSAGLTISNQYMTRFIYPVNQALTPLTSASNASATFQYLPMYNNVTATRMDALFQFSVSTTASATTASFSYSVYGVIYTRNAGTLSSLSSGSTSGSWTWASNTAGSTQFSQLAVRPFSVPINVNMAPGEYFVGFNLVTAGANISQTLSVMGANNLQTAANYAELGSTTNATVGLYSGMGVYAAATTGLAASYPISSITQSGASLLAANIALVFRNA